MKRAFLPLIAMFCWAGGAWALTLSAEVKPKTATVGDRLEYIITPDGEGNAELPNHLEDTGPFEVVDAKRVTEDGKQKIVFTLSAFKTGKLTLPRYSVPWKDKGEITEVSAPEVSVEIVSVLKPGDAAPRLMEIEPVAVAEYDWRGVAIALAIVIAVLAFAYAAYRWLKNRPLPAPPPPLAVPAVTPYEAALKKLERAKAEDRYGAGDVKGHFAQVADAVREYLRDEYGIDATEKTTAEMEAIWPPLLAGLRENVFFLLRTADAAKFAKIIPTRDEASRALEEAFYFVRASPKVKSRAEL